MYSQNYVSSLAQSHMRRRRFFILHTVCELISYDARIIFIHCQGINFVSKARGMTISSNLLLENEVKGVLLVPRPPAGLKQ